MTNDLRRTALGLILAFGLAAALPVAAEPGPEAGRWEFAGEVYLWGAGIGGTSSTGDDVDIDFGDLIDNLDFAFMGKLAARRDRWTVFADLVYLDVEDGINTTANIVGRPAKTGIDVELRGFISTLGGAYRIWETDSTDLNILAGVRYLRLEADLDIDIGSRVSQKYSDSGHVWDGIAGLRGKTDLNDKWYVHYYLDVGTGDSDLTWQALGGLNYRFEKFDAVVGYRYLYWDFDDSPTFDDLNLSGPYAGVKVRF